MKRFVTIYVQIAPGYFYCFDLMAGSHILGDWVREVLVGIPLLVTTGALPRLLQKYGSAPVPGNLGRYAGQAVNIGMSVARLVAG